MASDVKKWPVWPTAPDGTVSLSENFAANLFERIGRQMFVKNPSGDFAAFAESEQWYIRHYSYETAPNVRSGDLKVVSDDEYTSFTAQCTHANLCEITLRSDLIVTGDIFTGDNQTPAEDQHPVLHLG